MVGCPIADKSFVSITFQNRCVCCHAVWNCALWWHSVAFSWNIQVVLYLVPSDHDKQSRVVQIFGHCKPAIISQLSEVKFLDLIKTDYCESICQGCFHWSRTKVRKSKTIRYRPSLNHKPCRLETGGRSLHASFSTLWEMKVFGLRGEYGRKAET